MHWQWSRLNDIIYPSNEIWCTQWMSKSSMQGSSSQIEAILATLTAISSLVTPTVYSSHLWPLATHNNSWGSLWLTRWPERFESIQICLQQRLTLDLVCHCRRWYKISAADVHIQHCLRAHQHRSRTTLNTYNSTSQPCDACGHHTTVLLVTAVKHRFMLQPNDILPAPSESIASYDINHRPYPVWSHLLHFS